MILEAITLISTANSAIGAVKEFVSNGRYLMDCGAELGQYFDAKSQLQKQANPSGSCSYLQAFFALEKLKEQEQELQQLMIYAGRPGLWDDWLKFQSEAKRERDRKELLRKKAAIERAAQLKQLAMIFTVGLFVVSSMVGGLFIALL